MPPLLPLFFSLLALGLAVLAWRRSAQSQGQGADAGRDARRSLAAENEQLAARLAAHERWIAMIIAGQPPTPEMIAEGRYFFDVDGSRAREVAREKQAQWVDVRTEGEVQAGMIPGAQWIPMDQIEQRLDELPRDKPLILYCAGGVRSVQVCQFLGSQGFHGLYNLEGGMGAWDGTLVRP